MTDSSTFKVPRGPGDVPGINLQPQFVNRTNIILNGLTTRIALGEFVAGNQDTDIVYHSVITMPTADAISFARLILELYAKNQGAKELQKAIQDTLLKQQKPAGDTDLKA